MKSIPSLQRRVSRASAIALGVVFAAAPGAPADPPDPGEAASKPALSAEAKASLPATPEEARARAKLLYEMANGALQVMHRDFFGDDEDLNLPSQSLEDVFAEIARTWGVELHWLAVNAKVMDVDHKARDAHEESAVKALGAGEQSVESIGKDRYQFTGRIRLHNQCLKCHVPNRTSLEERAAGLTITIPLRR
ncbi:MAG: DUF3365 domain-containing protein [Verrucomicrobiales bacterium]